MNEPIIGYTHEGLPVEENGVCNLSFCPLCFEWLGFAPCLSVDFEFNKTAAGAKRPYVAIRLFGLLLQSGWLF